MDKIMDQWLYKVVKILDERLFSYSNLMFNWTVSNLKIKQDKSKPTSIL